LDSGIYLNIIRLTKFIVHPHPFSTNMTIISNDPTWWPVINFYRVSSYFAGS
jgi:hypothetical protein